jgi:hypothetical protein
MFISDSDIWIPALCPQRHVLFTYLSPLGARSLTLVHDILDPMQKKKKKKKKKKGIIRRISSVNICKGNENIHFKVHTKIIYDEHYSNEVYISKL